MLTDLSQITLIGRVEEQPTRGETEGGFPSATFHVRVTHRWSGKNGQECDRQEYIEIYAVGWAANSIHAYYHSEVEIVVVGTLRMRTVPLQGGGHEQQLYVHAGCIAYTSPRMIFEKQGRPW